ncbi:MAG: DUF1080 domain-containing protein [Sedimentisphaerales bacterium]|nr:DUF1080 domain-containing protein [Sedimentisphaerales bacterium]
MKKRTYDATLLLIAVSLLIGLGLTYAAEAGQQPGKLNEPPAGFTALFNGKDLSGWKGLLKRPYDNPSKRAELSPEERKELQNEADENMREHWKAEDGVLVFDGKGRSLCTAQDYGDFEMLVDWKIKKDGDSGIYLRGTPQVQIWDTQRPNAGVGSGGLYNNKKNPSRPLKVADKPVGEWNTFRIIMIGDMVTVFLNDVLVVDHVVMENYWERDKPIYPREQIELQSHGNTLYFRNIFIKPLNELTESQKKDGFKCLFNGKDLTDWKGLLKSPYDNPAKRAELSSDELKKLQKEADEDMRAHWKIVDGALVFDGKGHSLCTMKDYGDFEMFVDWKIGPGGDSGLYLRGTPQVQIWDIANTNVGAQVGSGGLYNNKKNENKPKKVADRPVGEWNTFHIYMIGDLVTVILNGEIVVDNVVMENYWERDKPIYPTGQIELQSHGSTLYFRNIYIREIPREKGINQLIAQEKADGFKLMFNGKDLTGWEGNKKSYFVENETIVIDPKRSGNGDLFTANDYGDFIMRFEFRLTPGANNGLAIRTPFGGHAAYDGMELQILDHDSPRYKGWLKDYQHHGSIYGVVAAKTGALKPVGEWNCQEVTAKGKQITIKLNGTMIVDADLVEASTPKTKDGRDHPGLLREKGRIGFAGHGDRVEFRNLRIKSLD